MTDRSPRNGDEEHSLFMAPRPAEYGTDPTVVDLTPAAREAIVGAVEAVVRRDVETVRGMLDEPSTAETLWHWADDYGDEGRLELVMPPGDVHDWDISLFEQHDGGVAADVEMWATSGETDLTLQMELSVDPEG